MKSNHYNFNVIKNVNLNEIRQQYYGGKTYEKHSL